MCARSFNYLLSLALGLHIVSEDWLIQSNRIGKWQNTNDFEVFMDDETYQSLIENSNADRTAEKHGIGTCRKSRILYKSTITHAPLFGYTFFIPPQDVDSRLVGDVAVFQNDQIEMLVRIWGGKCVSKAKKFFHSGRRKRFMLIPPCRPKASWNECESDGKMSKFKLEELSVTSEGADTGVKVIDYYWIVDSIATCALLPLDRYHIGQVNFFDE